MTVFNDTNLQGSGYTRPWVQVFWMLLVLAAVAAIGMALSDALLEIFFANRYLNGVISGVFLIGVLACFVQVGRLIPAAAWAERFAAGLEGLSEPPRLLASMSALLGTSTQRIRLTPNTARVLTDALYSRVSESRDIARYLAGLLIFLGLLGTFWGLARTIPALTETIRALAPQPGEAPLDSFGRLQSGFEAQLAAMGTAFASSLLGLAGSLVVGLLELLASHAQSRFLREFEEWVSAAARVESRGPAQDPMSPAELRELVERNARQISSLLGTLRDGSSGDTTRIQAHIQALEEDLVWLGRGENPDPGRLRAVESDLRRLRDALAAARSGAASGARRG